MTQDECNKKGTSYDIVKALNYADIPDQKRLHEAIIAGDKKEAGRLIILFYEDYMHELYFK